MKSKQSFLFISCEEAKLICDKVQYSEASKWEVFKLNLRLLWCHLTRSYMRKTKKLSKLISAHNIRFLNVSEKEKLQKAFSEVLKNKP